MRAFWSGKNAPLPEEAEEGSAGREKTRAALLSVLAALFLTLIKLGAGLMTDSLGVLAEAAHSALDLLAAGVTFLAVRISSMPADRRHAYGHGKAENLAALAETLTLLLTCGWIVWEAVHRLLLAPPPLKFGGWAVLVLGISILVDFSRSRLLLRTARKYRSQALEADALHFSTDILSSGVVIAGLLAGKAASFVLPDSLLQKFLLRADALSALAVAVIVAWVSLRLGKQAVDMLLDAGSADHLKLAEEAVSKIREVLRIKKLRLRESGPSIFIDMQLVLPGASSLEYAHGVTEQVEKSVLAVLPGADLTIHFEPEEDDRPDLIATVRKTALQHSLDVHAVKTYAGDEGVFITLHAAVQGDTPLREAHSRVEAFEQCLRGPGYEILTHLEPRREKDEGQGSTLCLPPEMEQRIRDVIDKCLSSETGVSFYHRLRLLDNSGRLSLSLHCCMPGDTPVSVCHESISRIERFIQREFPQISRITIHADVAEEAAAGGRRS
ncbi:MAG: cation-efflux pump [Deltaproteobacteria bacterium]|jgi:cation diffusion facilitator family transporter|nr:cation-efflux pump [Deltaproteobacteria bacterium]